MAAPKTPAPPPANPAPLPVKQAPEYLYSSCVAACAAMAAYANNAWQMQCLAALVSAYVGGLLWQNRRRLGEPPVAWSWAPTGRRRRLGDGPPLVAGSAEWRWAEAVWDFHRVGHAVEPADGILVLCSHDVRVADKAVELYDAGMGRYICVSRRPAAATIFERRRPGKRRTIATVACW